MNCLYCDKPIQGRRNTKRYCSKTCKQYAYLKRNSLLPQHLALADTEKQDEKDFIKVESQQNGNAHPDPENTLEQKAPLIGIVQSRKDEQQENYKNVWPDIFQRVQDACIAMDINSNYFLTSGYGSRINNTNFSAFSYVLPRLRCIIENLFLISYKRKVYHKTIKCLLLALRETLFSGHMKTMPGDFPFLDDLLKLYDSLNGLEGALREDKGGIKFSISKTNMVKYLILLGLIRKSVEKKGFEELFPKIYSSGGNMEITPA